MLPVAGRAAGPGGFVLAVLIGLALFAITKSATPPPQQPPYQ
jgi:hypothetical protein